MRSSKNTVTTAQSVRVLPLYRQAEQACKRGCYQQAASLLNRLCNTPVLNPEQRAFCQEQRQICLRHVTSTNTVNAGKSGQNPPHLPNPLSSSDCGPRALLLACQELGVPASLPALCKAAGLSSKGVNFAGLIKASESVGLKAEGVQVSREALPETPTPAIAWVRGNHFVEILSFRGRGENGTVTIHDPNQPQPETLQQEQLLQQCGGYLLLLKK